MAHRTVVSNKLAPIELEITSLTHSGEGVGRHDGQVFFVADTLPGDRVVVQVMEQRKRLLIGKKLRLLRLSPDRTEPLCLHAAECGGCQFQPLQYSAQLRWKQQQVADALERIGKLSVQPSEVVGMEHPFHYRSRAQFPVVVSPNDVWIGFYRRSSHWVVPIEQCQLLHPQMVSLLQTMQQLIGANPAAWRSTRHLVVRFSSWSGQLMLTFVTRNRELPPLDHWLPQLLQQQPDLASLSQNIQPHSSSHWWGEQTFPLWGEQQIEERLGSTRYSLSPGSFFQVNPAQTVRLFDRIAELLQLSGNERILDLYCGVGSLALYLAPRVKEVVGVELYQPAVDDARHNAQLNGAANARFLCGRSEELLPQLLERPAHWLLLDPPRDGCAPELIQTILENQPPQLLYLSCNPATLARDLALLSAGGYQIDRVEPFDLFPWTHHIETVVTLRRGEN